MSKESEKRLADMIGRAPLFSGLKEKQLKTVVSAGQELSYEPGKIIVKEGDMGAGFYLILDGSVEVRKGNKVLSKLTAGQFFGEMALLDRSPRSADVVVTSPTRCYGLTPWAFTAILRSNPQIALNLLKELIVRLRKSNEFTE